GGVPERADRARVAEHDDLTASAQERPQGLVVGDGGAGGRHDQHRAREERPPPQRQGGSTILPNCGPPATRAYAAALSLSGTTAPRIALEPAREEQSHHVVGPRSRRRRRRYACRWRRRPPSPTGDSSCS